MLQPLPELSPRGAEAQMNPLHGFPPGHWTSNACEPLQPEGQVWVESGRGAETPEGSD